MMNVSGNCYWFAGDCMMVNFLEIEQIKFLVYELGLTVFIFNQAIYFSNFGDFVSGTYDAQYIAS